MIRGSSWDLSETRRFIWNNWLLLLELDGDGDVLRKLTWGLDLAGQRGAGALSGAGGIGGLLAVHDPAALPDPNDPNVMLPGDFLFFYDANGNVGQLVDWAFAPDDPNEPADYVGAVVAKYEYDAYGNPLLDVDDPNASGPYAAVNPYRFSTKPWDDIMSLGYWGERYYDPRLGRWVNRDPIGERGGKNLYGYVHNAPMHAIDAIGHASAIPGEGTGTGLGTIMLCALPPRTPLSCFKEFGPCYGGTYVIQNGNCVCAPWPDGPHGESHTCPDWQYWDCKLGECVAPPTPGGDVYGNCCGANRDCAPTGCSAPIPGNCFDAACGSHDQCYYYNNISAVPGAPKPWNGYTPQHCACDCALVRDFVACDSAPPFGVKNAARFFCTWMSLNNCPCAECGIFD